MYNITLHQIQISNMPQTPTSNLRATTSKHYSTPKDVYLLYALIMFLQSLKLQS